jgi:hypothetical protein
LRCGSSDLKPITGKQSFASEIIPDRDLERDRDPSEPRIRCPLCGWSPQKEDKWFCTCGHEWNTFDTGGVCPAIGSVWITDYKKGLLSRIPMEELN